MKKDLHPDYIETTVHCNGCNTTFKTHSTVPEITVEICSNCHPFYTGKQKLVDVAGRVDRFKARQEAAAKKQTKTAKPKKMKETVTAETEFKPVDVNKDLRELKQKLEKQTVNSDQPGGADAKQ